MFKAAKKGKTVKSDSTPLVKKGKVTKGMIAKTGKK